MCLGNMAALIISFLLDIINVTDLHTPGFIMQYEGI